MKNINDLTNLANKCKKITKIKFKKGKPRLFANAVACSRQTSNSFVDS